VNWPDLLLAGFIATSALTVIFSVSKGLGLTRIDLVFLLGSAFSTSRDRAKILGAAMHFVAGYFFALVHVAIFQRLGFATWWLGALTGACHGILILTFTIPILPALHPRMVSDFRGPEPTRLLEPPGFLALNYGRLTPWAALLAHVIYGALLGAFYRVI
jgi:hypothetical protein